MTEKDQSANMNHQQKLFDEPEPTRAEALASHPKNRAEIVVGDSGRSWHL